MMQCCLLTCVGFRCVRFVWSVSLPASGDDILCSVRAVAVLSVSLSVCMIWMSVCLSVCLSVWHKEL
jgi:hypothetical protein